MCAYVKHISADCFCSVGCFCSVQHAVYVPVMNCSEVMHAVMYHKATCIVTAITFGPPNDASRAVCSKQLICF